MQSASVTLTDKLKQDLAIYAQPRLIAEWSLNRYVTIQSCTNPALATSDEFDLDMFPITSIVEADRPTKGILKAIASTNAQISALGGDGFVTGGYIDAPSAAARYMTASVDDKYKYYTSGTTAGSTYNTTPTAISGVQPTVVYSTAAWSNKLYIGVESSYAQPSAYTIDITTDGSAWTNVASEATAPINTDGSIVLYRQADNSWATTIYRENPVQIRGVRMTVTQMNRGGTRFNLIELGARLESDLSQFVISYSVENSMSETSFVAPLGVASANSAHVSLSNVDGRFTDDNPSSLYYSLLEKNVEFRMDLGINIGTVASPNYEYIRQFTMRTETWNDQTRDGTDVELHDDANFLQSVKPQPALYQNMTIGEIIWRMLDSVGYSRWAYDPMDNDATMLVPQFWNDGKVPVWESISKLAQDTQTAIYFNEFGILQIQTRNAAYNLTNPVAWQLDAVPNGSKQPDIKELKKTYDFEANVVNVRYKPTSISKESDSGVPVMETVWEPEDTVVLRSSNLISTVTNTGLIFKITPTEATTWPYTGIFQVEGEFVRYSKKGYTYKNAGGTFVTTYIASQDEKEALDKVYPGGGYVNYFNGDLQVASLTDRGIWGTTAATHELGTSNWVRKRYRTLGGTIYNWNAGFIHEKNNSTVRLITNSTFTGNSWYVVGAGSSANAAPAYFGTRLRFTTGRAAGLAMGVNSNDAGYYVELLKTASIGTTERTYTNELCFYVRHTDGSIQRFGPNGGKGIAMSVIDGAWYDLDVKFETVGSNYNFLIRVNGAIRMAVSVPTSSGTGLSFGGGFAMFVRGYTNTQFEYFYTATNSPVSFTEPFDEEGWWDRIKDGYQSGQWDRQWTYGYTYVSRLRYGRYVPIQIVNRYAYRFMDEFGPIVHEVREFDVEFSKSPVLHSSLYLSNDAQVINPEYLSNPFKASFVLANASRENAIVSGEDTLTYGEDNPVSQKFLIYGRTFTQEEERTETVKDEAAVKRRGEQALDIDSEWVQTEAAAKALGNWIVYHWSGGADEVDASIFGNPLLQLGDIVSVNYPLVNMAPSTHQYFVVGLEHSFDNGLETNLKLRRRKI
jgi:hypothetical protein